MVEVQHIYVVFEGTNAPRRQAQTTEYFCYAADSWPDHLASLAMLALLRPDWEWVAVNAIAP